MENKKRYALNYDFTEEVECFLDRETNEELDMVDVRDLLNEQDEKIKNQEKIITSNNQKLINKYFEELNKLDEDYNTDLDIRLKEIEKLKQENQQLKQSQNSKAIEVLEKVKKYFCEEEVDRDDIKTGDWLFTKDAVEIAEYIDNQITKLKEKIKNE